MTDYDEPNYDEDFLEAIQSTDRRRQLEALRDKVAKELSANHKWVRANDMASLVLRLQKILEELDELPESKDEEAPKTGLEALREQTNVTPFDRKRAPRQQSTRERDKKREA